MSMVGDWASEAKAEEYQEFMKMYEGHDCKAGPDSGCSVCAEGIEKGFLEVPYLDYDPEQDPNEGDEGSICDRAPEEFFEGGELINL